MNDCVVRSSKGGKRVTIYEALTLAVNFAGLIVAIIVAVVTIVNDQKK